MSQVACPSEWKALERRVTYNPVAHRLSTRKADFYAERRGTAGDRRCRAGRGLPEYNLIGHHRGGRRDVGAHHDNDDLDGGG
jgi:hypothetical protein